MSKSIIELTITVTTELSPEEFIDEFNAFELESAVLHIRSKRNKVISPKILDYDIINIDKI